MVMTGDDGRIRCAWAAGGDPLYCDYHDTEWGRPVIDDTPLFEKLCLEGFQSGLSWLTILRKREAFRAAFAGFDPGRVAAFDDDDVDRLVHDATIVRHRAKIASTIANARRMPALTDEFGSLAAYVWAFEPTAVHPEPVVGDDVPSTTPQSVAMSRDLKRRGWSFIGPTTAYAFMQAMGLVNDHLWGCWARIQVEAERSALTRPVAPA